MPDTPDEFVERAEDFSSGTLTPEEFEVILRLGSEFIALDGDIRIFILGSFGEVKQERLDDVEETINNYPDGSFAAFQMSDLLEGDDSLNAILKYRLLGDYANYIKAVCEDDSGGHAMEQGMIAVLPDHLQKTYLFKREYHPDLEKQRYAWMQSKGFFEMFEDRLHTWTSPDELIQEVKNVLNKIAHS